MLKKVIKYTDYNGNEREETFYFALSKPELVEMELSINGGLSEYIERIMSAQDTRSLIALFKDLILKSYGEKSLDGKHFTKSEELSKAFSETEAYTTLFMELVEDADTAANFVNGILPTEIAEATAKATASGTTPIMPSVLASV